MAGNRYLQQDRTNGRNVEKNSVQTSSDAPASGDVVALNSSAKIDLTILPQIDFLAPLFSAEVSVTAAITATVGRQHVCSGTSADYTVTLPAASGNAGRLIGFRMASGLTKLVTLDGNASETLDGVLTRIMWAGESCVLLCDGSNWFKVAGVSKPQTIKLVRTTTLSIAHNTLTDVTWTAATWDDLSGFTSGTTATIRRGGRYDVIGTAAWASNSTGLRFINAATSAANVASDRRQALNESEAVLCDRVAASVSDTFKLTVYQTSGAGLNLTGATLSAVEVQPW